jgi:hypothetical protein
MLSVFYIPSLLIILLFFRKKLTKKIVAKSILFFALGLLPYLLLILIAKTKPPLTIDYDISTYKGFIRYITGADFSPFSVGWIGGSLKNALVFYYSTLKAFINPLFLLIVPILIFLSDKKRTALYLPTASFAFLTLLFSLKYQNAAIERYFIPSYVCLVYLISAVGFMKTSWPYGQGIFSLRFVGSEIPPKRNSQRGIKTDKKRVDFIKMALLLAIFTQTALNITSNYIKNDQSKNFSAKIWAEQAFVSAKKNSTIFSWWSYSTPMWYLQKVERKRPDITIINTSQSQWEQIAKNITDSSHIYFIQEVTLSNKNLLLEKSGSIYELVNKSI